MSTLGAKKRILKTDRDNEDQPAALSLRFDKERMYLLLQDGRELQVPLILFPRLFFATPEQREQYEIGPYGEDIHWDSLDEDISVHSLLLPPDQVQYYNDDLLLRLLSDPSRRALYEFHRHQPISWAQVDRPA
ncbi:MAG TPA: DUF2442 domain-containing protein [Chloroflexia bacterium]|jgi:hypothetical protein